MFVLCFVRLLTKFTTPSHREKPVPEVWIEGWKNATAAGRKGSLENGPIIVRTHRRKADQSSGVRNFQPGKSG